MIKSHHSDDYWDNALLAGCRPSYLRVAEDGPISIHIGTKMQPGGANMQPCGRKYAAVPRKNAASSGAGAKMQPLKTHRLRVLDVMVK